MRSRHDRLVEHRRRSVLPAASGIASARPAGRVLSEGSDPDHDRLARWRFSRTIYRGLALDRAITGAVIAVSVSAFWGMMLWFCYRVMTRD